MKDIVEKLQTIHKSPISITEIDQEEKHLFVTFNDRKYEIRIVEYRQYFVAQCVQNIKKDGYGIINLLKEYGILRGFYFFKFDAEKILPKKTDRLIHPELIELDGIREMVLELLVDSGCDPVILTIFDRIVILKENFMTRSIKIVNQTKLTLERMKQEDITRDYSYGPKRSISFYSKGSVKTIAFSLSQEAFLVHFEDEVIYRLSRDGNQLNGKKGLRETIIGFEKKCRIKNIYNPPTYWREEVKKKVECKSSLFERVVEKMNDYCPYDQLEEQFAHFCRFEKTQTFNEFENKKVYFITFKDLFVTFVNSYEYRDQIVVSKDKKEAIEHFKENVQRVIKAENKRIEKKLDDHITYLKESIKKN